jgi:hypothetical protein
MFGTQAYAVLVVLVDAFERVNKTMPLLVKKVYLILRAVSLREQQIRRRTLLLSNTERGLYSITTVVEVKTKTTATTIFNRNEVLCPKNLLSLEENLVSLAVLFLLGKLYAAQQS